MSEGANSGSSAATGLDSPSAALDPIAREAQDWVVRFASGEATEADLREGKLWCDQSPLHRAAFVKAGRLWDGLRPEVFKESFGPKARVVRPIARRAFLGGAVAASAASGAYVLARPPLGLWPSWSELAADYRTETGEQRRISLADNVSIEMNTQTSIAVQGTAGDGGRIELIAGEAMIATPPGTSIPFTIVSGDGRASAVKAKFNVRNDGAVVCVTCLDGEVEVEHRAAAASLRAGQQVAYDRDGLGSIAGVDPAAVTAWHEGLLIFHATPLRDVIAEVNRYRSGKIILMNAALGERLLSADFHIRNIDSVIGQVKRLFGARATSFPGGIVLLS